MSSSYAIGINTTLSGKANPTVVSDPGFWTVAQRSLQELAEHISNGFPWMPALLDGDTKRNQQNSNFAAVLGADVDNGLTIQDALKHPFIKLHCGLLIESASSKPEHHKFRLVFPLFEPLTNWMDIRLANQFILHQLKVADPACKDASRFFWGAPGRSPHLLNDTAALPADFLRQATAWRDAEESASKAERDRYLSQFPTDDNRPLELAKQAITYIPAYTPGSNTYGDLIAMCFGVLEELGAEGESLLEAWGGFGPSTARKISGMNRSSGGRTAGLGSLFYLAKQHGFKIPKSERQSKGDRPSSSAGSDSNPFTVLDGGKLEAIDETEYQAELEAFRESESTLKSLSEARFSDMGEEFFLGTGKIYEVCGGSILPNIRNGWMAASLAIGQILASLCPRSARIIPPDQRTSLQGPQGFVNIEGAPSAGKSVIFESIVALMTGLSRVEYSRSLILKEVQRELRAMEDSDEGLPPGLVVNPSLSKVHPSIRIGDFTLPALKTAIAAAGYWPYVAKQFTSCQLRSAGTLIFNREAVSMFESFSQNNQSEQGLKAAIAGFWAGEQEPTIRKTDSELIIPEDSVIGMVTACQSGQMRKIIETEIKKKAGAINTGFGLRFVSVDLENTAKSAKSEFIERDYSQFIGDPVDLHPLMEQFAAVVSVLGKSSPVIFTDEATAFYRDIWFEWLNDQTFTGWFDGYKSKAQANLIRMAWAYRCMAIFDDIANGVTNIELKIGQSDVARAFEVIQRSTAKLVHEVALIEKNQDLDEKSKESEKQQSLVKSKYHVLFTDPSLTHQWVMDKRSTGTTTFRLLLQKVKGSRRAELKKQGVDVALILRNVWDRLESGPIAVPEPPAPIQPDETPITVPGWTAGNIQDVRTSVLNNPESAEQMRAHVPKELWSQVGISA